MHEDMNESQALDSIDNNNRLRPIIVTDTSSPDHMLTFDEMVYKGYDVDAEKNKKESISIYEYPLCLYIAYKQILIHSDNPRITYISDIQRYSTLLGHAILERAPWYLEIERLYNELCDSENSYVQETLDSSRCYGFRSVPIRHNRRGIKTLMFIKEALDVKSNILGITCSSLVVLCSLMGLKSARLKKTTQAQIIIECNAFKEYILHEKEKLSNFKRIQK